VNPGVDAKPRRYAARALELTDAEFRFMQHLAPHVGRTPRRALRFLNIYRVIKASLDTEELHVLQNQGGYRALMSQVAVATGAPELLDSWLALLAKARSEDSFSTLEASLNQPGHASSPASQTALKGILAAFWSTPISKVDNTDGSGENIETVTTMLRGGIGVLQHYAPLAKRYSFSSA
jgi:hypothetical protein